MGWGLNIYELVRMPIKKVCNIYYLRWYYNGWHYWAFLPGKYNVVTEGENYRTIGTRKISMSSGQVTLNQAMAIRTILNTREVYLLTIAGWMNIRIEPGNPFVYNNMVPGEEIEIVAIIGSKEITYSTGYSPVNYVPTITPPEFSSYCEVVIGTQIWMCKNWDSNYPGSKVYNNDETNRALYGGLYSYDQVMNPGFVPIGWHFPTIAEWDELITFLGGSAVAGKKLKAAWITYWNLPNTGTDEVNFNARGGGWWGFLLGSGMGFYNQRNLAYFWAKSPTGYSYLYYLRYDSDEIFQQPITVPSDLSYQPYISLRLIKDALKDIDGNSYTVCNIGSQQWIIENLRTTKYADGTSIPNLTNDVDWLADTTGSYRWYDDNIANKTTYGALYNWYATVNPRGLAYFTRGGVYEPGWRVPSLADFNTLIAFVGAVGGGGILKEVGLAHWNAPNTGASDNYGFKGLPGGRKDDVFFMKMGDEGDFGCTDQFSATHSHFLYLLFNDPDLLTNVGCKTNGCSIRCVRDI